MNKEKRKKYVAAGVTGFLTVAACVLFFFVIYRWAAIGGFFRRVVRILQPVIVGAVIAYLVAPLYNLIVRNMTHGLSGKMKPRGAKRCSVGVAVFACVMVVLGVVAGVLALVIPRFVNSFMDLCRALPTYSDNLIHWITGLLSGRPELAAQVEDIYQNFASYLANWLSSWIASDSGTFLNSLSSIFSGVVTGVSTLVRVLYDFIVGMIIAGYLLVAKKRLIAQTKKITYGIFRLKAANFLLYECRYANTVFGGFIRGKLLDSLIVGLICFVSCLILRFPYPVVISVIIGVTNIIPFFGPFIGAIPCTLLILMVHPIQALWFLIFILALQQFDGNVLGPKILGNTTGLPAFWVLFSIILFGGLFGFVGMIIAVPLFAVIYSLISGFINYRLKRKDLPTNTEEYEMLEHVDDEDRSFQHGKDPTVK